MLFGAGDCKRSQITLKGGNPNMKKNDSNYFIMVVGNNNNIQLSKEVEESSKIISKKRTFKSRVKAFGKFMYSIFAKISVLLVNIFAKLG